MEHEDEGGCISAAPTASPKQQVYVEFIQDNQNVHSCSGWFCLSQSSLLRIQGEKWQWSAQGHVEPFSPQLLKFPLCSETVSENQTDSALLGHAGLCFWNSCFVSFDFIADRESPCHVKLLRSQKVVYISCGEEHTAVLTKVKMLTWEPWPLSHLPDGFTVLFCVMEHRLTYCIPSDLSKRN